MSPLVHVEVNQIVSLDVKSDTNPWVELRMGIYNNNKNNN